MTQKKGRMLNINLGIFQNEMVRKSMGNISATASRRKLGILRWDNLLDIYPYSGVCVHPTQVGYTVMREPFYWVLEKVNDQEMIRIKPVKGDQYSIGDVYGFFGLHGFDDYKMGMPIILVEGISDWVALRKYYKYVLTPLTAWITHRQAFFLSGLTDSCIIAFDNDDTGIRNTATVIDTLAKHTIHSDIMLPPQKDWGGMSESEWGNKMIDTCMQDLLTKINANYGKG